METKICARCKAEKPCGEFRRNVSKKDGLQAYCIPCDKEKQREHYKKNKARYIEKSHESARRKSEWWREYKKGLRCNRCSENHPSCLQFHHLDPKEKEVTVSQVIRFWSEERIMQEIHKCEVLCANCHFKEHWAE